MDRVTSRQAAAQKPEARPALQILPPRCPLEMPVQSLAAAPRWASRAVCGQLAWRRGALLGLTGLATFAASTVMTRLLRPGGVGVVDALLLGLFAILFAWVVFAMISACAGFVMLWRTRGLQPWRPQPTIFTRTALLMPTYGEDPAGCWPACRRSTRTWRRGASPSSTTSSFSPTRAAGPSPSSRWRGSCGCAPGWARASAFSIAAARSNLDRKAGNIADWVKRFGGAYESMIILDADSLMTGDTIVRLTAAMEHDPKLGLIQTLPTIIGATTLFGASSNSPVGSTGRSSRRDRPGGPGLRATTGGTTPSSARAPSAACAGLPYIEGRHPFSGHIMSHDFVEAALLRRGGWAVRMASSLTGSFEETPPSLLDMAVRDRRWCQGNLQHAAVLSAQGLHWVSRLHLVRGILAYLTAPMWLAFLVMGNLVWAQQRHSGEMANAPLAAALFALTFSMLLLPKALGAILIARDRLSRRACGGAARLTLGVLVEIVFSALMSPVLMLLQSHAIVEVLCGRHSGWAAQRRDDQRLSLKAAWRRHWSHTLLGVVWAVIAVMLDPVLLAWTSPVAVGLVLAVPISILTSRVDLGQACRRLGLFVTPEETAPPQVMARAAHLRGSYVSEAVMRAEIDRLFRDPVRMWTPALPWGQII